MHALGGEKFFRKTSAFIPMSASFLSFHFFVCLPTFYPCADVESCHRYTTVATLPQFPVHTAPRDLKRTLASPITFSRVPPRVVGTVPV